MQAKYTYSIIGVVSALLLTGCLGAVSNSSKTTSTADQNRTLGITIPGEPMTTDPTTSIETNGGAVITQTGEGIYRKNANNKIVAGLVEKKVKPTENKTRYTFTIRKNARWQNGTKITSQDFVTALRRQANPTTKSQNLDAISYIKNFDAVNKGKMAVNKLGVTAINKRTFSIKLSKPVPYMNYEFTSFYPLNTAAVQKYGSKLGSNSATTVANGAYVIKGWKDSNDSWYYVKNKYYWNAKNVKIKRIKVTVTKDDNTAQNLFNAGTVQVTNISGQYVKNNANNSQMTVTKTGRNNYIYFNSKKSVTANENFRHALSLVINQKTLAKDVLQDGSQAATNIVPKNYASDPTTGEDFVKEVGNLSPTNIKQAKQYWQKAQKELGKQNVTLNFLCDDTDTEKKLAEYVQGVAEKYLKGVTIKIVAVPHATHVSRDFTGNFDLVTVGWGPDYPDAQNFLDGMQSSNSINFTQWKDAKYDALMAKVSNTAKYTAAQRWTYEKQADRRLMKLDAVIPTYQASSAFLVSKDVGGLQWDEFSGTSSQLQYAYWK